MSRTLWESEGYRIDVEDPAPGVRAGQIHLQKGGVKYMYDFENGTSVGILKSVAKLLASDPRVARALAQGFRYLGLE